MAPSVPLLVLAASNLIGAINDNDLFGKLCILVLLGLSFLSIWGIVIKYLELRDIDQQSRGFQEIVDSEGSWESVFLIAKKYPASPLAIMYRETYIECRLEKWFAEHEQMGMEGRLNLAQETVGAVLDRTLADQDNALQSRLTTLSMVATLAPFIGLLGTVWGILDAFMAIGDGGSASLSVLAPGISTALVTTIFGLVAAIPAVVAHNRFSLTVQRLSIQAERFARDIENAVRKQIAREKGVPR